MSSKDDQEKSPTDTTSATDATPMWSLEGSVSGELPEYTTVKCSTCKVPTVHEWFKIKPKPLFPTNDMIEVASKSRRMTMCTQCGLVKTIT